jgi:RNA-binding protein YlmH
VIRETISRHFTDDDRNDALNLYERYLLARDKNIPTFGKCFYPPNIWTWFEENLSTKNFKVETNGFFKEAERKMISFNNEYETPFPMKLIKIENTSKFSKLTHRDFLGGILSLGIERNKIGDLLVDENVCYVPIHEDVEDFIIYNLDKIAKVVCKVSVDPKIEQIPEFKFKEEIILISSLRIDGVVSKITNLSRAKASTMIEQGQVLINYVKIKDKSYELKGEERITIRGFGKFIIGDSIGNSKSGKIKVIIKKYT